MCERTSEYAGTLPKLYFFSPAPDEQVGNPFDIPPHKPEEQRKLTWLRRWLAQLGIRPLHAALGAALLLIGLIALGVVTRRHAALVQAAVDANEEFNGTVRRAQETKSSPSESEAVRRSERAASAALAAVHNAEQRFRPLKLLFRNEKKAAQQQFVESVRGGYLLPELDRSVRQRARERILYSLVALYATNHNTLGSMVRAHPSDWSQTIGVAHDILLDYVQASEEPWHELALQLLPQLPSESGRWPVNDLRPWREFVRAVVRALPLPYITQSQLKTMQQDADKLLEALAQVRKAAVLRQIFRALTEETPLDMVRLFGRDAGALYPAPWIVDHFDTLEKLLTLVRDSSLQFGGSGHMSLFRLLKWINELNASSVYGLGDTRDAAQKFEDEIYHFPFPDEKPSEVSRRAWIELLLRSRKRLLLAYQVSAASSGHHSHPRSRSGDNCCGCERPKKRHHRAPASCPANADDSNGDNTDEGDGDRRSERSGRDHHGSLPLWNHEEFAPKLASLMASDDSPNAGLEDLYNRPLFEKEVLPLVQELKKALAGSKNLSPEEKLRLAHLVQSEVGDYSRRYCAALRRYYLSYHFSAHSPSELHSNLLNLTNPGSTFVSHLRTVADNAKVAGLDEPYLRPLAQCLAQLQPVVAVVTSQNPPAGPPQKADPAGGKGAPAAAPQDASGLPEGLKKYKEAVSKLISELDGTAASTPGAEQRPSPLGERLGPLGKTALAAVEGLPETPLRMAEKFLDEAGISDELRPPFLSPFQVAYKQGMGEIEQELGKHWRDELLPQVANLFTRFPFNRAAEREVAPAELEALNEARGTFWQDLKSFYAPVLAEHSGTYAEKPLSTGHLELPSDMLPTVNRMTKLARALFRSDGSRQPLRLIIRGLPGRPVEEGRTTQGSTAFVQVGRASAYNFNQQGAGVPISVDWWDQGVSMVGVESTTSLTGRRQTQSIEVADSAWSLFRLLQKSTLDKEGVSTWHLIGDGPAERQNVRFIIQPDPWTLFQVQLP